MIAQETRDAELYARAALSFSESVSALVLAEHQRSMGDHVTPYGGPWGFGDATYQLQEAMRARDEKNRTQDNPEPSPA
jgi:hypothetical protein